jgi:hypothetical protein
MQQAVASMAALEIDLLSVLQVTASATAMVVAAALPAAAVGNSTLQPYHHQLQHQQECTLY